LSEELILSAEEVRVVGALIEKQVTTPEYYPLTLNALRQACNQLSNREPVVSFDERTVVWALESLRDRKLVRVVSTADGRVPKYRHVLDEALGLKPPEMAVMCVLMLRGAQTVGEIRTRTERLYPFSALSFVETTLEDLMMRDVPLVVKLPRLAGQKESRYAHLLGGAVEIPAEAEGESPRAEGAARGGRGESERVARLEAELKEVRAELAELRGQFAEFKKQFE
jgi:uncharacterized protein YceH (UPF0502 family)